MFEKAYSVFIDRHIQARAGERQRRLKSGNYQAEKLFLENVWWPLFRNFNYLHPEYEIRDYKDGHRYLDFAYLRPLIKLCFEIDGYGPHLKQVSRWQFSDGLERQNHLVLDGWTVIRFSYDQVRDQPRRCQQITEQIIAKLIGHGFGNGDLTSMEKEVVRFALSKGDRFSPRDVGQQLGISFKTVKKTLLNMVEKGVIQPESGKQRIHFYRLSEGIRNPFL